MFVDVGDSTFVATADDAESTFALDVDTGSYRIAQAFLDEGSAPTRRRSASRSGSTRSTTATRPRRTVRSASSSSPAAAPHADDGTGLVRIGVTPPS